MLDAPRRAAGAPIRVTHVITTLDVGGAERLLQHLLEASDRERYAHAVVSLTTRGALGAALERLGWPVEAVGLRPGVRAAAALVRLVGALRRTGPDVVHTWMVHANLLGGAAAAVVRRPVVWSLHHDGLDPSSAGRRTRAVEQVNLALSGRLPSVVLCTSASARAAAERHGYPAGRLLVVPNGITTPAAPPDRTAARRSLGLPLSATLVGRVGRLAPQKDHETFLRALALVQERRPDVVGVLAGRGLDDASGAARALLERSGTGEGVLLLGERDDVGAVHRALDVAVSSSAFGETSPLVLTEAMALGVPVVATDVGDCAAMLEGVGRVVPPRAPSALADAVLQALADPPEERDRRTRAGVRRVAEQYSGDALVQRYEGVYASVARATRG